MKKSAGMNRYDYYEPEQQDLVPSTGVTKALFAPSPDCKEDLPIALHLVEFSAENPRSEIQKVKAQSTFWTGVLTMLHAG